MSAYNKLLKKNTKGPTRRNNRIITQSQDSDISQRNDNDNIFLQSSQQYIGLQTKNYSGNNTSKPIVTSTINQKTSKSNPKTNKKQYQHNNTSKNTNYNNNTNNQIQLIDDSRIPQGQQENQSQQNTQLSIFQSYKYYTGQLTHHIKYPISKIIAINNNNDEENIANRRILKYKKRNEGPQDDTLSETNQYYFQNNVKVSSFLLLFHILAKFFTTCWQWYLYVAIMITLFVVQKFVFYGNAQYVGQPYILLIVSIVYMVGHLLLQYLLIKNRKDFDENEQKFKVYYHDGVSAQWNMIQGCQIRAGHIYKLPAGSRFPTDAILLHSNRSIVMVDERQIRGLMPQPIFTSTIKQTIIKSPTIVLPISGMLQYSISSAQQKTINWFEGSLRLQQPISIKHNVSVDNVVYKNSLNLSNAQVLCMSLQVGSSSIHLKNVQYPHLWKDHEQIFEKHPQLLTIKKIVLYFLIVGCIGYLIMSGVGLLIGYLTNNMSKNHYYWGQQVKILHLLFYHFTNFVIFIPIFINFSILTYQWINGKVTQSNISQRRFQFSQAQIQNSISQTCGNMNIKDYSMIPYLNNPTTFVLGIQIFKQKKFFELKKIVVKQTKFDFQKNNIQDELLDQQQKNSIKSFMTVTLLTTTGISKNQNISFQTNIRKMAKQHLNLKLNQQKDYYTVNGPLDGVFTDGKLQVIHYFTVKGCKQYPYIINFYQIPSQKAQQNPQRRILCIVRGDPQTILMKAYGKKINLLSQAQKLHQQGGFQVHFVGKFTIFYSQAQNLKDTYQSSVIQKNKFYQLLDPLLKKVEPMGLLAFQNEFSQQNLSTLKVNPFLNLSMINKQSMPSNDTRFTSQRLPNMILICQSPGNYCLHPQFESVNTINRILGNPLLFNFTQQQIGDKILYDPIPVQQMIQKLNKERVVVFNGWDINNIAFMLNGLKQKGILLTCMIQKQDELYLTKLCDYTVSGNNISNNNNTKSYTDVHKYSDIVINQNKSSSKIIKILSLMQLLNHDSQIMYNGLYYIVLVHIVKFTCYIVVEAINFYFTLGSGLTLLRLPLYILTQIIVLADILYFLNIKDNATLSNNSKDNNPIEKKKQNLPNIALLCIKTVILCLAGSMILIQSSIVPHSSQGTPVNSIFCIVQVHLFITHMIIFSKLQLTESISWFQMIILIIQLGSYYIGILIISEISLYEFNNILRYTFNNKLYLVSVVCIWIYLTVSYAKIVMQNKQRLKTNKLNQYQQLNQLKRLNKQTNLQVIQVQQV